MKTSITLLIIAAVVYSTACKKGETVTGGERKQILAYADPMADRLFKGYNDCDMSLFAGDFTGDMKQGLGLRDTPPNDISWHTMNLGTTGKYLSPTLSWVPQQDGLMAVI